VSFAMTRGVNGLDRIGSDFAFTISSTMCFHRIQSGSDSDRMRIQKRIYKIADSERKWNGLGAETKLIGLVTFQSS
jgi:hypothetical protein